MTDNLKELLVQALKDQKEIFGDELYESLDLRKIGIVKEETNKQSSQINTGKRETPLPKKKETGSSQSKKTSSKIYDKQFPYSECKDPVKTSEEKWESSKTLEELHLSIGSCTKCILHKDRNKFVFGAGNPNADVMCVGEGPGADEDMQGYPFVGKAGQLLTDILKAINFSRDEVFIANVVKCRPPGNRKPEPDEMDTCSPYLFKQIGLIKPKLILCLGLTAAQGLLKQNDTLTSMRGKVFEVHGAKAMVTYHPAALLRNPGWKRGCWEDVQKFRKLYDDENN